MNATWTLLLIFYSGYGGYSPVPITGFTSEAACVDIKDKVTDQLKAKSYPAVATCIEVR